MPTEGQTGTNSSGQAGVFLGGKWHILPAAQPARARVPAASMVQLPQTPQERQTTEIQARGANRADAELRVTQQNAAIAAARNAREAQEFNATHNPDGSVKVDTSAFDPATVPFLAQKYLADGTLPPLGNSKQAAAAREMIVNEAARQAGAAGLTGADLARQIAHYKAGSKAIGNLETIAANTSTSEQTALANGQQFLDRAGALPNQSRFPVVNAVSNWTQRQLGMGDISAHDVSLQTFQNEYAKVVAGSPSGAGTLSDSARREAQETFSGNASLEQKQRAYQQMKTDMENRIAALHQGINDQYKHLTEKPGYEVPSTPSAISISPQPGDQKPETPGASGSGGPDLTPPNGGTPLGLASGGSSTKSVPIPAQMQSDYAAWVNANRGKITPDNYAAMRANLDQQHGFGTPSPEQMNTYRDEGTRVAGMKEGVGIIPPADAAMTGSDRFKAAIFNDRLTGGSAGAALMGAGSLGGGADEVAAGIRALGGEDYATALAQANAIRQAAADAHPLATLGGNIAGTALMGYGAVGLAARLGAPGLAQWAVNNPVLSGAGYGAVSGALEDNDNRLGGAVGGGLAGAGGGWLGSRVIGPTVAKTVGAVRNSPVAQSLVDAAYGAAGKTPPVLADGLKLSPVEAALLKMKPDLAASSTNLADADRLGLPYSIADSSPKFQNLAGYVTRKNPDVGAQVAPQLLQRSRGQADRAIDAIDTHLAPITDINARSADIVAGGKPTYQPLYDEAYAAPPISSPVLDRALETPAARAAAGPAATIAGNEYRNPQELGFSVDANGNTVLNPIPTEHMDALQTAREGWDTANTNYQNALRERQASLTPGSFTQKVADAEKALGDADTSLTNAKAAFMSAPGSGTVQVNPQYSTQTLDYMKGGIDRLLEPYRNTVTGQLVLDRSGRAINNVKNDIVNSVDAVNPAYARAREAYGRFANQAGGLQVGQNLMSPTLPTSDFNTILARNQAADLALPSGWEGTAVVPEIQRGAATAMADKVANARLSANPYEPVYGSTAQQEKTASLFPSEGAQNFDRIYNLEGDMGRTANEVYGNSATARRQATDQALDSTLANTAVDVAGAAVGHPLSIASLLRTGLNTAQDAARFGIRQQGQQRAADIGNLIFDTSSPLASRDVIDNLLPKQTAIADRNAAYARIAGLLGIDAALPVLGP